MQRVFFTSFFILACISGFGQIISNFTVNDEGWTVYATSTGTYSVPTYTASGGNPAGSGEISFGTFSPAVGFYFAAPAKFRGDLSAAYNQNLSFDLHASYPGGDNSIGDLIIANSVAGASLYYQLPGKPAYMGYGPTYTVQLVETFTGWHYGSITGPAPTSAQLKLVLGNITSLQIREKYSTGNTFTVYGYLDNVILGIAPPSITVQPVTPQTVCEGTNVTLSTSATGNPAITYQWQIYIAASQSFVDLTNNTTYSGVTTNTLTINTTGNVGAGNYYCRVSGTNAPSAYTNGAVVNVNPRPTPPTTTGAARCNPSTVPLSASGGSAGQYRWYTVSTGGTAITGETNSTFTTPSLTSTTTYYVAVNNGTCESTRTSVTATIQTCSPNLPPVITPTTVQTTIENKVTVNLSALVSDPDNNLDLSSLKVIVQPLSGAKAYIDPQRNLVIDYTGISFSGREKLTLEVCDLAGACVQKEFEIDVAGDIIIYNGMSPNGDNSNDFFLIQYIDVIAGTKKNHVFIYNRWGDLLFDVSDYDNKNKVFKGLNSNGNEIPSGTYFYKIEFSKGKPAKTGYLLLQR